MNTNLGEKLRSLREANGLRAVDVSNILLEQFGIQLNHRSIYNYEKNKCSPDLKTFFLLCVIYKCRDVIAEFGYGDYFEDFNAEEMSILDEYRKLSISGKDVIKSALKIDSEKL